VLAAEKKVASPLIDTSSVQKVFDLDEHCGLVYSGLGPDSRVLVDHARRECQVYRMTYMEPIPINQLVRGIAAIYQEFTQSGGVRPFGASLLVAGVDHTGYHLYQLDPSGTFMPWKAVALGRNAGNAKTFLEKRYSAEAEMEDAVHTALQTLKEGMDGKMTPQNTEVGRVVGKRFEILSKEQVLDYLDQI
jgi:20S proteasome subunit alpha 2